MKVNSTKLELAKSETVAEIPLACADELSAVEFLENRLWKGTPVCHHCQSKSVYAMKDFKTGERNKRFLWRCNGCKQQFTVRLGTVFEESRIPLRHWCYAFWRASTSKKGVSALEIKRHCQISYKSALFLMHRIRFAMEQNPADGGKMTGTVEVDETYVGGKAKNMHQSKLEASGIGTGGLGKECVLGIVQRDGGIHRRVVTDVSAATLKGAFVNWWTAGRGSSRMSIALTVVLGKNLLAVIKSFITASASTDAETFTPIPPKVLLH